MIQLPQQFWLQEAPLSPDSSPPSITRVTVILLGSACSIAYLGTEGGGVYFLGLPGLTLLEDNTLYQDEVLQR